MTVQAVKHEVAGDVSCTISGDLEGQLTEQYGADAYPALISALNEHITKFDEALTSYLDTLLEHDREFPQYSTRVREFLKRKSGQELAQPPFEILIQFTGTQADTDAGRAPGDFNALGQGLAERVLRQVVGSWLLPHLDRRGLSHLNRCSQQDLGVRKNLSVLWFRVEVLPQRVGEAQD